MREKHGIHEEPGITNQQLLEERETRAGLESVSKGTDFVIGDKNTPPTFGGFNQQEIRDL